MREPGAPTVIVRIALPASTARSSQNAPMMSFGVAAVGMVTFEPLVLEVATYRVWNWRRPFVVAPKNVLGRPQWLNVKGSAVVGVAAESPVVANAVPPLVSMHASGIVVRA